jgi:hypothetical protein
MAQGWRIDKRTIGRWRNRFAVAPRWPVPRAAAGAHRQIGGDATAKTLRTCSVLERARSFFPRWFSNPARQAALWVWCGASPGARLSSWPTARVGCLGPPRHGVHGLGGAKWCGVARSGVRGWPGQAPPWLGSRSPDAAVPPATPDRAGRPLRPTAVPLCPNSSVPSRQIRCRMTASLRAPATLALLKPLRLTILPGQAEVVEQPQQAVRCS